MITRKNSIAILILVIIVLVAIKYWKTKNILGNEKCIGCGVCKYEKFSETVKVKKIFFANDSINSIEFISTTDSIKKYDLDAWELSFRIGKEFSEKEIRDTLNNYTITGERIIEGTCTPVSIDKIKLLKK